LISHPPIKPKKSSSKQPASLHYLKINSNSQDFYGSNHPLLSLPENFFSLDFILLRNSEIFLNALSEKERKFELIKSQGHFSEGRFLFLADSAQAPFRSGSRMDSLKFNDAVPFCL
jgi:hypothetical protein